MSDYRKEYEIWCCSSIFNEDTRKELLNLTNEIEIKDRFSRMLTFGTGGLRGIIGAGTNRMNRYTVGKVTQGLANFINKQENKGMGSVVIAYDSRNNSRDFALQSALVLCGNGIKTYLFDSLRPTPELSFAVRYLKCTAGIVITASHNPSTYNGYKVYWRDGGQVVSPYDEGIIQCVNAVKSFACIQRISEEEARAKGLLHTVGEEIDDAYISAIKKNVLSFEAVRRTANQIKIVYTPLHGTGNILVRRILNELGFNKVWVVPEQELPDGNFPTVEVPNPEDAKVFSLALKLARKKDADIVLATDPDADRLGIYAKNHVTGEYVPFTGNMLGVLLADYRLRRLKELGKLPNNSADGALLTTVVSSDMIKAVAREYGVSVIEVLTGFKHVGEQINLFETAIKNNGGQLDKEKYAYEFLFGFEESYGYLVGMHARDKDAIAAVAAVVDAAAYYQEQGVNLVEQMQNTYEKYGYYFESQKSVTLKGAEAKKIQEIMHVLRETPLKSLNGLQVLAVRDYQSGVRMDVRSGEQEKILLPKSNVLYYELEQESWCCVRPSGTEPKIKFYFGVKSQSEEAATEALEKMQEELLQTLFAVQQENDEND